MTLPYNVRPYFKRSKSAPRAAGAPRTAGGPWDVPSLCAAYGWPSGLPGGGVLAIVELGGGWVKSDLDAFFRGIGQPTPSVTDISVDGTKNTPDMGPNSADYEVALDIEVAAAAYYVATGKPATVRVYWAQDIATAVQKAAEDGCDVCSISWGADEADWGQAAVLAMDKAAADATAAGMVVFAAAGDNDASDGGTTPANVDCPACCPHIVGCGGTAKTSSSETVWNNDPNPTDPHGEGTGGGYSTVFPVQSWQSGAPAAPPGLGRMVPDVAANADPSTGYEIVCHGSRTVLGGTSAVAPLYAGLFAALGHKLGDVNPVLWANRADFADITVGGNGLYQARTGPDACTGLGAPIGGKLAALFAPAPPAPAPVPPGAPGTTPTLDQAIAWATEGILAGDPLQRQSDAIKNLTAGLKAGWPPPAASSATTEAIRDVVAAVVQEHLGTIASSLLDQVKQELKKQMGG